MSAARNSLIDAPDVEVEVPDCGAMLPRLGAGAAEAAHYVRAFGTCLAIGLTMRLVLGLLAFLLVVYPPAVQAQSLGVYGAAGPTLNDKGYSLAAGVGFLPDSPFSILVGVDRTHLSTETRSEGQDSFSTFRGGTLTLASVELRVAPLGRDRFGPYGLVGFAAGQSKPNVNQQFPDAVTNNVRAALFGGGLHVPLGARPSLFADGRLTIGSEAGELLAIAPVRVGLAWRF
jgi:hypothetical protein